MSANGLHRIRWRRVAVARIHRTAASQFAKDLVNIQQSIVVVLVSVALRLRNFVCGHVKSCAVKRSATSCL